MSGSNNMPTRTEVFHWIAAHEDIFGAIRQPVGATGVYFSDETRNYYPAEFVASYRGVLLMLLQNHVQFRIVTPGTLEHFDGKVLVLPDVRVLSEEQAAGVRRFAARGGRVVLTGNTDHRLNSMKDAARFPDRPETRFLNRALKDFYASDPASEPKLLQAIATDTDVRVDASRNVVAHEALLGGRTCLFLANFSGLQAGQNETPVAQSNIRITTRAKLGRTLHVLPFLGTERVVEGKPNGASVEFNLPPLERGAVVWFQ